jgi:2-C-methyl-D-erythritol 2,4-cyclodiphosphate synthase
LLRIGQGFDVHAFESGRKLILGGVQIAHNQGLAGHSDADVLIHAVIDAFLGALSLGDIGKLFPDNDMSYKDADSMELLKKVLEKAPNFKLNNLDVTVICERPKIVPYSEEMRKNIASAFNCNINQISIKGTTTEKLGFTGRGEGIAAMAVILLEAY